ncbi:MAG: FeoB-associated Cys-rich membrane protein, partial [Patescibacteria group bacterium]
IMTKRTVKQIIIALIFFLVLFSFAFLIYYFIKSGPTCDDGIKNQAEEEIDCGGPCSSCELINIEDIEVLWVKVISNQEGFYDLAAQIKNPNQNYGSGQVSYQFELYDIQDKFIAKYSGSTFILPNQTKYLIKVRVESNSMVNRAKLSFSQIEWEKPENYQFPELIVQQKEYRLLSDKETGFSQARAVVINKTNFDFNKIDVDILLFDSFRNLIAINSTEISTLLANQERDFTVIWFNKIDGQVVFVEMEPETNIFDPDNYLPVSRGEQERFQEY